MWTPATSRRFKVACVNIHWYKQKMPAPRPYHHGHLKKALLDAALALIAETGARGFTLREAARRAGVSHNAPYRHFRDKDDLLAAVAADGFDRLGEAMTRAAGKAKQIGRAHV